MKKYKVIAIIANLSLVFLFMIVNYVEFFDNHYLDVKNKDVIALQNVDKTNEQFIYDVFQVSENTNTIIYYEDFNFDTETKDIYTTQMKSTEGYYTNVHNDESQEVIDVLNISTITKYRLYSFNSINIDLEEEVTLYVDKNLKNEISQHFSDLGYSVNEDMTFFNQGHIFLVGLVIISFVTLLFTYISALISRNREFIVKRYFGYSSKNLITEYMINELKFFIPIMATSLVLILLISLFLNAPISFWQANIMLIVMIFIIYIVGFILSSLFIVLFRNKNFLKGNILKKPFFIFFQITKYIIFIPLLIILYIFLNYSIMIVQTNKTINEYVNIENYVTTTFSNLEVNRKISSEDKKQLYIETVNEFNGIYIEPPQNCEQNYNTEYEMINCNTIYVNENYLKFHNIEYDNYNSEELYNVYYAGEQYTNDEIIKNFNTYHNSEYNLKEVKEIDSEEKYYLYSSDSIFLESNPYIKGNYLVDPVVVVVNQDYNFNLGDVNGYYFIDPTNQEEKLNQIAIDLDLEQYLEFEYKLDEFSKLIVILSSLMFIFGIMIIAFLIMLISLFVITVGIYLKNNETEHKLKYYYGYSYIDIYKKFIWIESMVLLSIIGLVYLIISNPLMYFTSVVFFVIYLSSIYKWLIRRDRKWN